MSFLNSSSSQSQANQSTATRTSSENVNVQPGAGAGPSFGKTGVGGDFNVTTITDAPAILASALQSNSDLASLTVDAAKTINSDSLSLAKSVSQNVTDFAMQTNQDLLTSQGRAFDFGSRAFGTVEQALSGEASAYSEAATIQGRALDTAVSATGAALNSASRAFDTSSSTVNSALSTVADTNRSALDTVATAASNALSVAAASTSSTYASTQTVKYVLYGLGAIAIAVAIIFAVKS